MRDLGPFTLSEIRAIYEKFMGTTPIHPNKSPWTAEKQLALVEKLKKLVEPKPVDSRPLEERLAEWRAHMDETDPGWRERLNSIMEMEAEEAANDPGLNMTSTVTAEVFGTNTCRYCDEAKKLLDKHNIPHVFKNLDEDQEAFDQLYGRIGSWKTVPQIFLGAEHVGGFDQLKAKLDGPVQTET